MKSGYLSEYFADICYKRLSAVETDTKISHQHEFDGVGDLKRMFGLARGTFDATFIYLCEDAPEPVNESGYLTWYDAREKHPTRSEYRLYFSSTQVSDRASEGDLLVIGRRQDDTIVVFIAKSESTMENQVLWLFGITDLTIRQFVVKDETESDNVKLEFASRYILEQIGIEVTITDENYIDRIIGKFGNRFPTTRLFSEFARSTVAEISLRDNPDEIIIRWMNQEEILFKTLERHLVKDRLRIGFEEDVEAFIQFSLSVQNRRKSRAGQALENHLEYLFTHLKIKHTRTPVTENKSKPDFIFPSISDYRDQSFPTQLLTMLAAKSSCKERWRQVIPEADRIQNKHLLTLEPSISEQQTDEMKNKQLQLVLPESIHASYTASQQNWIMTLAEFIEMVITRQNQVSV